MGTSLSLSFLLTRKHDSICPLEQLRFYTVTHTYTHGNMQAHIYVCTHRIAHKCSQEEQILFSVSMPPSECLFLTRYFVKKKNISKNRDNMTACSCEMSGNEDCKILVTIQYRRVNNIKITTGSLK